MKMLRVLPVMVLLAAPALAASASPALCPVAPPTVSAASVAAPDWHPASETLDGCYAETSCPTWEPNGSGGVYGSYMISCTGSYSCLVGSYEVICDGVSTRCSCMSNSYWDPTCPCDCYTGPNVISCLRSCS